MAIRRTGALGIVAVAGMLASPMTASGSTAPVAGGNEVRIEVLSNRADLVSGGDVLVEVVLPRGVVAAALHVDVDGRDVTAALAPRPNGRLLGLVTGLAQGANRVTARIADGRGAFLTITNHPIGGPVFSGAQVQPWLCTTESQGLGKAQDAQCNAPTLTEFFYMPTGGGGLQPYDRENPPSDVAMTTTDEGRTVPYIVRQDTGTQNRGLFRTAVLYDPSQGWEPWAPQQGWNRKMYYLFGASGGTVHSQSAAPSVQNTTALSRGFLVASSSMNTLANNGNTVTSAESVMMLKEHVIETYGEIRYAFGSGQSGGSIGQQLVVNGYPGLLNGVTVGLAFSDFLTIQIEVQDCVLLVNYFTRVSPHLWANPAQQAAVTDQETVSTCVAQATLFGGIHQPRDGCGLSADEAYDPDTNPDGCRGTLQDFMVAIWGRRPQNLWTEPERMAGGFAKWYFDNVGVQYGLKALRSGLITPEQFVDLNERVGGFDIDDNIVSARRVSDPGAPLIGHRASQMNDGSQLDLVPLIDSRSTGNVDPTFLHTMDHSFTLIERMRRSNGHADNHVIWRGGEPAPAFDVMDRWLNAVELDSSGAPLESKILTNRPPEATDMCFAGSQQRFEDTTTCDTLWPYYGEPRTGAGGSSAQDVIKCQLKPLDRDDDYGPLPLIDLQWERLKATFPDGVCDWSKPGVDQVANVPWLSYANGPGGQPVGPAPQWTPFGGTAVSGPAPSAGGSMLASTGGGVAPVAATTLLMVFLLARRRGRRAPAAR